MDQTLQKLLLFRVRVGRVSGIDINLHWSLLFVALYFLFVFRADPRLGVLFVLALFGSIFLHEMGHCWGARRVGGEAREVTMWPLGGLAMLQVPMAPWPQFVSTVCGPLVNLLLAIAFFPILLLVGGDASSVISFSLPAGAGLGSVFVLLVIRLNLILLVFNVIPAYPMDGGRILQTALWPKFGFHKSLSIAIVVAMVCATGMVVVGLWTHGFLLACIGISVIFACLQERRMLQYGAYDEELAMSSPWASSLPGYGSGYGVDDSDDEPQPSKLAQWREKRRQKREEEEAQRRTELRARLDEVLAKVSAGGLDGLSQEEKRFLEHASAELRKEQQQP